MKLTVNLRERSYDVIIKRGVLAKAGMLANLGGRVMVVTDDGVPARYVKTLLAQCGEGHTVVLPAGEWNKTADAWLAVLRQLQAKGFGADDLVVSVGGGTVSDVAGFAAACYRRGVAVCHFPTTTTAQLDAAIGGRCGIDVGGGLSNVGAVVQPRLVAVDPDTLDTLPPRVYAAGMAEAVKTGLVASRELFDWLERATVAETKQAIERVLYLCVRAQKNLVEQDERATGERRLLGFGTTLGLALLASTHSADAPQKGKKPAADTAPALLHGEAVALGMLPMLESRVLRRRLLALMEKWGLPTTAACGADTLMAYLKINAQAMPGVYPVVRVKTPGEGHLEAVDEAEMRLIVEAFTAEVNKPVANATRGGARHG